MVRDTLGEILATILFAAFWPAIMCWVFIVCMFWEMHKRVFGQISYPPQTLKERIGERIIHAFDTSQPYLVAGLIVGETILVVRSILQ